MIYSKSIILFFTFTAFLFAQTGEASLNGFVYDKTNGETLIGASILLKPVNRGTSSNLSGYYVIPKLQQGSYEVVVTFIGYKSHSHKIVLKAGEEKTLDFTLEQDALQGKEIVIRADSSRSIEKLFNKPVSKIELSAAQISKVPQVIEADLLRTLQTLPGIVPLSDFSSAIYVRGGTPDQNLFMVDGTDVYNPEHAFGLFSTFNTDAIKKVEVYKGGFGAEYGGRLSSVINITNNDGNKKNFEGKAALSLLSLNGSFSSPLGSLGSISGSIRRTYLDQTIAKWVDDVPDYYFIDGNLKTYLDLDHSNKLILSFFGSNDNLNFIFDKDRPESFQFNYTWGNMTGSANWKTVFTPKLFGNFWFTASRFKSVFDFKDVDVFEENIINDLTFKGAIEYFYNDDLNFKFGFEQKNINGGLNQKFMAGSVDVERVRNLYALYLSTNYKPSILWDIEAGIRTDYFVADKDFFNIDPRLTIKYRLDDYSNIKFSTGIFHQYANRIPRLFFVSIWTTADKYVDGSSSNHFVLGYQRAISEDISLEAELYYKDYKNIYSFNQTAITEITPEDYDEENRPIFRNQKGLFNKGNGSSAGLEILLRKEMGSLTGMLSYSYSATEYTLEGINQNKAFAPRHDRTHAVNLNANVDLNNIFRELSGQPMQASDKQWSLGINFTYFSGQPITLPSSIYLSTQMPDWDITKNSIAIYPSGINEFRLPYYSRLDLSLTYTIQYDGWVLVPYFQVFNALNRKNVWFIQYKNEIKNGVLSQEVKNIPMFPILPSIGVSVKF